MLLDLCGGVGVLMKSNIINEVFSLERKLYDRLINNGKSHTTGREVLAVHLNCTGDSAKGYLSNMIMVIHSQKGALLTNEKPKQFCI